MTTSDVARPREGNHPSSKLSVLGLYFDKAAAQAVLFAYLTTRLMTFLIVFVSLITLPVRPGANQSFYATPYNLVLDGLVRWDSWAYANIVEHGYTVGNIATGERGTVVFFPLYVVLIEVLAELTGNIFVAGVLISNVAFLIALAYLYRLTRREFDDETARRTVFYVAAAPTSIFFSAMYTESLFVALVTATFYYSGEGKWTRAALLGALASATRNTGILLAAVIALEGMHRHGVRFLPSGWRLHHAAVYVRRLIQGILLSWRTLLAAALVPVGLILYMSYLSNRFGDPLAFITAQATFGRDVSVSRAGGVVGYAIRRLNVGPQVLAGQINATTLLDILFTLGFGGLIIGVAAKMRPAYTVFTALTFAVPLLSGTVSSMTRYVLMLVPCFMLLAYWGRREWVDRLVMGMFLPLMAYFTVLFSHWYFAG